MPQWPNGPILSGPGIIQTIVRILERSTRAETGPLLRTLAARGREVLRLNPTLATPTMLARFAELDRTVRQIERQRPALVAAEKEAFEELTTGIEGMTSGIQGVEPELQNSLRLFGVQLGLEARRISSVQAQTAAFRILAARLQSPLAQGETALTLSRQNSAALTWRQGVEQVSNAIDAAFGQFFSKGLMTLTDNVTVESQIIDILLDLSAVVSRIEAIRLIPNVTRLVKEAVVGILPETAQTRAAFQFFSPNTAEDLQLDDAVRLLDGPDQARLGAISRDVDAQLTMTVEQRAAIGDWVDGAENTFFARIFNPPDLETIRYSAAWKGLIANQKSVIPFVAERGGPDALYVVDVASTDLRVIRAQLAEVGIEFRTLVPITGGTRVVVFDPGRNLVENIRNFGRQNGRPIEQIDGRGEFLGGETRPAGARAFRRVIEEFETRPDRQRYRPLEGPRIPSARPAPPPPERVAPERVGPLSLREAEAVRQRLSLSTVPLVPIPLPPAPPPPGPPPVTT